MLHLTRRRFHDKLFIGSKVFALIGAKKTEICRIKFWFTKGHKNMHSLTHSLFSFGTLLAVLITVGVGVLLFCCLTCSTCGCKEKDELFRRKSA